MVQFIPASRNIALEQLNESLGNLGAAIGTRLRQRSEEPGQIETLAKQLDIDHDEAKSIFRMPQEQQKPIIQHLQNQKLLKQEEEQFNALMNRLDGREPISTTEAEDDAEAGQVDEKPSPSKPPSRELLNQMKASGNKRLQRLADAELKQMEIDEKRERPEQAADIKRRQAFLEKIDEDRDTVNRQGSLIRQMDFAINEGDLGFFSGDNLANNFPRLFKNLVSPEGKLLSSATKEFLLADLAGVKGRPNVFLESNILRALPEIGVSQEANQVVLETYRLKNEIDELKIQVSDEIEERFREKGERPPANIAKLVNEEMKGRVEKLEDKAAARIRNIQERNLSSEEIDKKARVKQKDGTVLTPKSLQSLVRKHGREKAIGEARKLNYKVPTQEDLEEWLG